MTKLRLNDVVVRQLKQETGQARYFDDTLPGFGLTVGVRAKTWFVVRGTTRKLTTIGRYPDISLQDARKQAKRLLTQAPDLSPSIRLVDAIKAYLEDIEERLRPSSVATYSKFLKNPPDIALKELKKTSVTLAEPNAIKTWKVFGNWCLRNELLDRNPFQFIKVEYGERERVLTNEEIKLLWAYDYPPFSHYLKLLLLTGQRRSQFTDFEIREDTLFFPARIMKGKRDHTIPLTPLAHEYIKQLQPFNGWSKGKARIDSKVTIPPWVLHDCRRTFSTMHAQLGTPIQVTEKILDHRTGTISGVGAIYNRHSYLEEARSALLTYEAHLRTIISAEA